jgi:hypothetical protein
MENAVHKLSRSLALLSALALSGTALPALALQVNLAATLTGAEEVPANTATATGTLTGSYDSETNVLDFSVTYSGLSGDATAAHFHGPAAPGENAPPVVPVDGPLASPIAGTATLTDAQEAELLAGMWYFNVHTAQFPDGEIRGQVLQSASSGETSMDSSMMSEMPSEMPSGLSSESSSVDVSASVSVSVDPSVSVSVDPSVSVSVSASVDPSVSLSVDPSVSVSTSVSASGQVSVSAP